MSILILDAGSSSVRALLMDDDAQMIDDAVSQRAHNFDVEKPGQVTADAKQVRQLLESCVDDVLAHESAKSIRAVGMGCFVGNLLGVDDHNEPVTPVYTYADSQSADSVDVLAGRMDLEASHQRIGCRLHTAYHPPKLHWLKQTQPDLVDDVALWTDFATYCYCAWFGRPVPCSYSVASWSGLLNRVEQTWDETWLEVLGLDATQFPQLADMDAVQIGLSPEYAQRWPALAEVPFYLAVGDGAAANIGSGAIDADTLALTIGTTAAVRRTVPETSQQHTPFVPSGLWGYRVTEKLHLIGGATTEGGSLYEWARETLNLPDEDAEAQALLEALPGQHGLHVLPLFAGERSPGWWTDASGVIQGLRLGTSSLDILQALMEAVALRLAMIADQLGDARQVYAGGGALHHSRAWPQMLADALGVPIHLLATPEVTARGIALLVLSALDDTPLARYEVPVRDVYKPRAAYRDTWAQMRQQQQALYDHMRALSDD